MGLLDAKVLRIYPVKRYGIETIVAMISLLVLLPVCFLVFLAFLYHWKALGVHPQPVAAICATVDGHHIGSSTASAPPGVAGYPKDCPAVPHSPAETRREESQAKLSALSPLLTSLVVAVGAVTGYFISSYSRNVEAVDRIRPAVARAKKDIDEIERNILRSVPNAIGPTLARARTILDQNLTISRRYLGSEYVDNMVDLIDDLDRLLSNSKGDDAGEQIRMLLAYYRDKL